MSIKARPGNGKGKHVLSTRGRDLVLRRRGRLAAAQDQTSFSSRKRQRQWEEMAHAEHHSGTPACTRWEILHQIPQRAAHTLLFPSPLQGPHVPARQICALPALQPAFGGQMLQHKLCTLFSCRHRTSNRLWEVFNCCVQLSPMQKWREAYKSKLITLF